MTIHFDLVVLGHLLGSLGVRIAIDEAADGRPAALPPPKFMDAVSDYFAGRWFWRHS